MNKEITLKPLFHRGQESIALFYENHPSLNAVVRELPKVKWSQTNKCWYMPLSKANYNQLVIALKGKATIEKTTLHQYLADKKKKQAAATPVSALPASINPEISPVTDPYKTLSFHPKGVSKKITVYKSSSIHDVNTHVVPLMEQQLKLKAYSPSTIKTYLGEMSQLLQILKNIPADSLQPEHLKRYLVYCYDKLKLTEHTLHSRINAMKFYYEQVLGRERFFWEIPRPKRPLQLPRLLNETEIAKLFNALTNKKHKAMLFTAYSSGLRVSEVANLKLKDIDSKRMQILIRMAKGKKDRYVNLSPVLLDILRNYIKSSKPRPAEYLFESEQTNTAYPIRTIQQIFTNAKKKSGIKKDVGIHSLRHSFATHLLDKGTDIRYIKDLLGHFDIRTTERYLHVSKKQLVNIISPFDDLWKKETIDW